MGARVPPRGPGGNGRPTPVGQTAGVSDRTRPPRGPARPRRELADIGPLEQLRAGRLAPRLTLLLLGLFLYGASMALVVRSVLGLIPWVGATGVSMSKGSVRTSRVAS